MYDPLEKPYDELQKVLQSFKKKGNEVMNQNRQLIIRTIDMGDDRRKVGDGEEEEGDNNNTTTTKTTT
jgi:hypothetical protein